MKSFTHPWTNSEINYEVLCYMPYKWQGKGHTGPKKLKIVLEGMGGTISIADLCRTYDMKPARFYYWKDQLDLSPLILDRYSVFQ